jgi:hypothetical protein
MALTSTSISAALSANSLTLVATSATGATVGGFAKVDGEYMFIDAISGTQITVRGRGSFGTAVVAHNVLAPLTFGLTSDLTDLGATQVIPSVFDQRDVANVGADGAIACPNRDTLFVITKGAALASSTFANPGKAQNGLQVSFTSATLFAHVVTLVTAQDGTTGNHTTVTFPAFAGASVTLVAVNGTWNVLSNNLTVIT